MKASITMATVSSLFTSIKASPDSDALDSLKEVFRDAFDGSDDNAEITKFVLDEMDGILRGLLTPHSWENNEAMLKLVETEQWKDYAHLVESYFGSSLHLLNQVTTADMIEHALKRLRHSTGLFAAFSDLRKEYTEVVVRFWRTGGGTLPVVSFLNLRALCVHSAFAFDSIEECFKGLREAYDDDSLDDTATKLLRLQFLGVSFTCLLKLLDNTAANIYIPRLRNILDENFTMNKEFCKEVERLIEELTKLPSLAANAAACSSQPMAAPRLPFKLKLAVTFPHCEYLVNDKVSGGIVPDENEEVYLHNLMGERSIEKSAQKGFNTNTFSQIAVVPHVASTNALWLRDNSAIYGPDYDFPDWYASRFWNKHGMNLATYPCEEYFDDTISLFIRSRCKEFLKFLCDEILAKHPGEFRPSTLDSRFIAISADTVYKIAKEYFVDLQPILNFKYRDGEFILEGIRIFYEKIKEGITPRPYVDPAFEKEKKWIGNADKAKGSLSDKDEIHFYAPRLRCVVDGAAKPGQPPRTGRGGAPTAART